MIEDTYRKFLTSNYVSDQLEAGELLSAADIETTVLALINELDLSIPQFEASNYHTVYRASSSANMMNGTVSAVKQDLSVLYRDMIALTRTALIAHERWDLESSIIEKQLIDLEDRIENLLLLTQDTEGYFAFLVDNFTDMSLVDQDQTTASVNIDAGIVTMAPDSNGSIRLFLENLALADDLSFRVRTTKSYIGRTDTTRGDLKNIFKQSNTAWWTSVKMKDVGPVTCELTVRLSTSPVDISKIIIDLHESTQSGPVTITPLYSVDNVSYSQLPTNTFSQQVRKSTTFTFSEVSAKWVKFLLTKIGPDPVPGENTYNYQFGFKSISFWQESFDTSVTQTLVSQPLYALDTDGNVVDFEKVVLDACDRVETNTDIRYYITTSNVPTVPISSSTFWTPVSPVDEIEPLFPQILSVGETTSFTYGDTEDEDTDDEIVKVSYDGTGTTYLNPASPFTLLSNDGLGGIISTSTVAANDRYIFLNNEDRILNYQVETDIEMDMNSLRVFRNVGYKGLTEVPSALVRGIRRGWGFNDPWYTCVIWVKNPNGISIDVGSSPIVIDGISYTGTIGKDILTGQTVNTKGLHTVSVHKNNWKYVTGDLSSLSDLKGADPLYPFNHRLLIEGYNYSTSYPSNEEKTYIGADLIAETLMQRVSVFDILHNVQATDIERYALDLDAPDSHSGGNDPARVFLVKCNSSMSDSKNERFVIDFKLQNQMRNYLRLRADMTTLSSEITPAIDSYKIKLG